MSSFYRHPPWGRTLLGLLFLFVLVLFHSDTSLQASEKLSLFNGKDLQGWEGDDKIWSVQDGQIVGSTVGHKIEANTFLIWKDGEVEDFRLVFKARVDGENNSGVQYRRSPVSQQAEKTEDMGSGRLSNGHPFQA